jgi:hypothetical protein
MNQKDIKENTMCSDEYVLSDEEIIAKDITMSERRYLLAEKYGRTISELVEETDLKERGLFFRENKLYNLNSRKMCLIDVIECRDGELIIEGRTNLSYYIGLFDLYAYDLEKKRYNADIKENKCFASYAKDGTQIYWSYGFTFHLPIKGETVRKLTF